MVLVFTNMIKRYVDIHIMKQPSTGMHGCPAAATIGLLGYPSYTWFSEPLSA